VVVADRTDQPGRARSLLVAARAARAEHGERYASVVLTGAALDIGALDQALPEADRLAAEVPGPLVELLHAEAHARADGDGDRLEEVGDRAEGLGLALTAWRCALAAIVLREQQGDRRGLIRARARAHHLKQRCPGLVAPPTGSDGHRPDLTPRELEVARLAAGGLASAAIAERLFVSVRTVDHHLGRVYLKVGVNRRADLRTVPGLVPA
jgi:DNA-binding CsgD family transcriptional regulator